MHELVKQLQDLLDQVVLAMKKLDIDGMKKRQHKLETAMAEPNFWDDAVTAAKQSKEHSELNKQIAQWHGLKQRLADAIELANTQDHELEKELQNQLKELKKEYEAHEFELTLSGVHDKNSAILHIHAGTGGTDAMDWAQMLERMYLRWAEQHDYIAQVISESAGEEAGLKSAIINIEGSYAFGKLKGEHGTHRLVRLSPFNADNLRQTSFALVEVLPQIDEPKDIAIAENDLKIDVYRSSGKGGQSVNTTDSAVRITHLPTGVVVAIQNERSQLQNRETAMKILRARLAKLAHDQHQAEIDKLKGPNLKAEWGQQIRNYVMQPYTLVKDTRSGFEVKDVQKVLDGDIDPFIEHNLQKQIGQN